MPLGSRRRPVWLVVLALVAGAVLGACTGGEPATASERLTKAVEDTFSGSYGYRISAEADRAALSGLGEGAGQAAAFLNTFALSGVVDGDVVTFDAFLLVSDPIVQVRRYSDEEMYFRLGLLDLPIEISGQTQLETNLLAVAQQEQLPQTVTDGIQGLFQGRWVGVVGPFDPAALAGITPTPATTASGAPPSLQEGLPAFLRAFVEVNQEVADDGTRRYDVDLRLRDLLRSLAGAAGSIDAAGIDPSTLEADLAALPETVAGRIDTEDGVVTEIHFDVAEAARALGRDVPGQILLRLQISDPGNVTVPDPPDDAVDVPSEDLASGLSALLGGAMAGAAG
jgi:hypothetical protein